MFRKLCQVFVLAILLLLSTVPAFASSVNPSDDSVYSTETNETQPFFVAITKPEGNKDATYKKTYVISGNAKVQDVRVWVLRYNPDAGKYVKITDTDGADYWDSGSYGLFACEFLLKEGENRIRVVAQRISLWDGKPDTRTQITDLTITKREKSFFESIFDGIGNIFKSIIPPIK